MAAEAQSQTLRQPLLTFSTTFPALIVIKRHVVARRPQPGTRHRGGNTARWAV